MHAQDPVRITAPAVPPVSLAEAKAHLRVDSTDEDALITGLVASATAHLDGYTGILGRAVVTQTWRLDVDEFPIDAIDLPLTPVQSVTSVVYIDRDDVAQTLDPTLYDLVTRAGTTRVERPRTSLWPATARRPDAVRVTFVVGDAVADVPAPIKSAALLIVGDLYHNREAAGPQALAPNPAVHALIAPYRRVGL